MCKAASVSLYIFTLTHNHQTGGAKTSFHHRYQEIYSEVYTVSLKQLLLQEQATKGNSSSENESYVSSQQSFSGQDLD